MLDMWFQKSHSLPHYRHMTKHHMQYWTLEHTGQTYNIAITNRTSIVLNGDMWFVVYTSVNTIKFCGNEEWQAVGLTPLLPSLLWTRHSWRLYMRLQPAGCLWDRTHVPETDNRTEMSRRQNTRPQDNGKLRQAESKSKEERTAEDNENHVIISRLHASLDTAKPITELALFIVRTEQNTK